MTVMLGVLPLLLALIGVHAAFTRVLAWRRAMRVLEAFSASESHADPAIPESILEAPWEGDVLRWRVFRPQAPRATVLIVHGVNYKGIHEPRLERFARAVAHEGITVVLPELPELCDYRIDPRSIDRIGMIATRISREVGAPVGVIGTSFAGGLSVMAAARPEYAPHIKLVFSLGGHESAERVSRYLATGEVVDPSGVPSPVHPHDYGMLVLLHAHAQRFFPARDLEAVEAALTTWLHEDRDVARTHMARIQDARVREDLLALMERGERGPWIEPVLRDLAEHPEESRAISPLAIFPQLRRPVYLAHGAGDSVIPAVESMYFAYDAPSMTARSLISPAIVHVEVGKGPNVRDQLALVDFLADVLAHLER